jgi:hypothetical protein
MHKYIQNILPRIKKYSKQLEKKENFIDFPWVFIDEDGRNHEYLFMRDNRLIMSLTGKVTTGSWELLPNGKLLINRVADQIMLENMFIDDALMILKRSGSEDSPFILINEKIIPDYDVKGYFEKRDEEYETQKILNNSDPVLTKNGVLIGSWFYEGQRVNSFDGSIVTGYYRTNLKKYEQYVIVENNIIKSIYFHVTYKSTEIDNLLIKQKSYSSCEKGDLVINYSDLKIDSTKKYKIMHPENECSFVIIDEKGIIIYSNSETDMFNQNFIISLVVIVFIIFILLIASI